VVLPRLEAARLLMAWQVPAAGDLEAVIGCDLLTTLLAEGRRSRLVDRLREQLRLVESIDLDLNGLFGIPQCINTLRLLEECFVDVRCHVDP
jgi:predicted Zn-dependent peptidase